MHRPVLCEEVVGWLAIKPGGTYIDGTAGGGGHAAAVAARGGESMRLLLIDRDTRALALARERLRGCGSGRHTFAHGNFADLRRLAAAAGIESADGILLDLGLASDQLDDPARGFSFMQDGPLDMRMDPEEPLTAETVVNEWDEHMLADVLRRYGEEHAAGRIARAIVRERNKGRITHTIRLADIITRAVGARRGRIHPATRSFQALRMVVNREQESLADGLEAALALLKPGGRLAVISFHSLEDRVVKQCIAEHVGRWESRQAGGREWRGREPRVTRLTKKPVVASEAEVRANPRSRSAKLRVAERNG